MDSCARSPHKAFCTLRIATQRFWNTLGCTGGLRDCSRVLRTRAIRVFCGVSTIRRPPDYVPDESSALDHGRSPVCKLSNLVGWLRILRASNTGTRPLPTGRGPMCALSRSWFEAFTRLILRIHKPSHTSSTPRQGTLCGHQGGVTRAPSQYRLPAVYTRDELVWIPRRVDKMQGGNLFRGRFYDKALAWWVCLGHPYIDYVEQQ